MAGILSLLPFLQQAASSTQATPEVDENGIPVGSDSGFTVTSPDQGPPPLVTGGPEAPDFGNVNYLEAANTANRRAQEATAPDRHGMFGVRGTLRDVLGLVGDAFLVQSKNDPIYGPARDRERMADIQTGYTASPEAGMAAVERLNAAGYGKEAQTLYDTLETQRLKAAQVEELNRSRAAKGAEDEFKLYRDASNNVARLFAHPAAQSNPDLAIAQAQRIAASSGIPLERLLGVPLDKITPEFMQLYSANDMSVNQTTNVPFTERRVQVAERGATTAERNAASNAVRASRPPAGRAPANPTAASIAAPLLDKLARGGTLTPAEQQVLDRTAPLPAASRGGGARAAPTKAPAAPARAVAPAPGWGQARVK